ncbi:4a-hydroxytetrahydrobiopterin dehydratase [Patescibacteria group bacterium]|nr:4a-hydroxytetrahydrobiopterin dehydratase [Patescibacteria group bacterium]
MSQLTDDQKKRYREELPDWTIVEDRKIEKEFKFKDFAGALAFVNQVGEIAEKMNHHPNIYIHGWNKVKLTLTTFATGGLSSNDFIEAQRINRLK